MLQVLQLISNFWAWLIGSGISEPTDGCGSSECRTPERQQTPRDACSYTYRFPLTNQFPFTYQCSSVYSWPFTYQPLDRSRSEIRLLELYAAPHLADPLEGRLIKVDLDDKPAYHALSYMWGDAASKDVIYLDGHPLRLGENLGRALRHIRHHEKGRDRCVLWVDGVCIDQSAVVERGHQVSQMGDIYQFAEKVCVWLDEYSSVDAAAIQRLVSGDPDCPPLSRLNMHHWADMLRIINNPYWRRVWIQGEVLGASQLTFYLQNIMIPGDDIKSLVLQVKNLIADVTLWSPHGEDLLCISQLAASLQSLCLLDWAVGSNVLGHRDSKLITLMYDQMDLNVSDDRDRVYALLPISRERQAGLVRPDYSLSVQDVFLSAFQQHVELYQDLDFALNATLRSRSRDLVQHFPKDSWLQSWAQSFWRSPRPITGSSGWIPCLSNAISSDSNVMSAHGFCCDTLLTVKRMWDEAKDILTWSRQWEILLSYLPELATVNETGAATLSKEVVLLLGEVAFDGRYKEGLLLALNEWRTKALVEGRQALGLDDPKVLATLSPELRRLFLFLSDSTIFATRDSRVGMTGGCDVVESDEVWIIFGCKRPLILRPREQYYVLVGSANIPGYMYGEMVGGYCVKGPYKADDICNGSVVREIKIW